MKFLKISWLSNSDWVRCISKKKHYKIQVQRSTKSSIYILTLYVLRHFTPLRQLESKFFVDFSERHDENEVYNCWGGRGDGGRLWASPLVLKERNSDKNTVHDDGVDEDYHDHNLKMYEESIK